MWIHVRCHTLRVGQCSALCSLFWFCQLFGISRWFFWHVVTPHCTIEFKCAKKRSVLKRGGHGRLGPIAWLVVWSRYKGAKKHIDAHVNLAQVDRVIRSGEIDRMLTAAGLDLDALGVP